VAIIAPSILAADWGNLNKEVLAVTEAGADWLHMDVMDGHFVPPITFGPKLVQAVKKISKIPLDVHLMIEKPENQLEAFAEAGAASITVHQEACPNLAHTIELIKATGVKAGISIKPNTAVSVLEPIIGLCDLILIMSVEPGWGGQEFMPEALDKLIQTRELIKKSGRKIYLEVDGGINAETAKQTITAGADALVAGTYIFKSSDYCKAIASLRT
jgi:ribulose-phosphate 3-epimerase